MAGDVAEASDKRPASRQVADRLLARIEAGDYPVGSALPTYRTLASEHGVAVNTAMAAVRILRDHGVVSIRPNVGAHVRDRSAEVDTAAELHVIRSEVADLRAEMNRSRGRLSHLEQRLADLADQMEPGG